MTEREFADLLEWVKSDTGPGAALANEIISKELSAAAGMALFALLLVALSVVCRWIARWVRRCQGQDVNWRDAIVPTLLIVYSLSFGVAAAIRHHKARNAPKAVVIEWVKQRLR